MIAPAISRARQFDRLIFVPAPDHAIRLQILKIHPRNIPFARDVDVDQITSQAAGYSGADLEGVCREAGLISLGGGIEADKGTMGDFWVGFGRNKASVARCMEEGGYGFTKEFKKQRGPGSRAMYYSSL